MNNSKLNQAIIELKNLDKNLSPVEMGRQREDALVKGLHGLAERFGKKIDFTHIDANGEMNFNLSNPRMEAGVEYGQELAAIISRVPRRTGHRPTDFPMLPENNWCRINHFDVERLLLSLDLEPSEPVNAKLEGKENS